MEVTKNNMKHKGYRQKVQLETEIMSHREHPVKGVI